jgi:hypothetical protein
VVVCVCGSLRCACLRVCVWMCCLEVGGGDVRAWFTLMLLVRGGDGDDILIDDQKADRDDMDA